MSIDFISSGFIKAVKKAPHGAFFEKFQTGELTQDANRKLDHKCIHNIHEECPRQWNN
jgi:hypothetical protein